jgi:Uma2 family endonuclease
MLDIEFPTQKRCEFMPSLNHSYICLEVIKQLLDIKDFQPLPELTLDIENGLTPDVSVFSKKQVKPNFLRDVVKFQEMPLVAIEVISPTQNIQDVLEKAASLVKAGVGSVWTIEPYGRTIFVTTESGENIIHDDIVETEGVKVDFSKIFKQMDEST